MSRRRHEPYLEIQALEWSEAVTRLSRVSVTLLAIGARLDLKRRRLILKQLPDLSHFL